MQVEFQDVRTGDVFTTHENAFTSYFRLQDGRAVSSEGEFMAADWFDDFQTVWVSRRPE